MFWPDSKLLELYRPKANTLKVLVSQLAGNYLSSLSHFLLSTVSEKIYEETLDCLIAIT